ncbi:MAG: TonB family protein [Candidatus Omnitrophica bacterium]|nr:TonB family protein [Candidatus Omnitrophota bacterium]
MNSENRIFKITLIISLALHGALLIFNPYWNSALRKNEVKETEINYVRRPETDRKKSVQSRQPLKDIPSRANMQKINPPPYVQKDSGIKKVGAPAPAKPDFVKPEFSKPDVTALKRKINLPALEADKINNPSYMNYYQLVREKIRRSAYQNYTRDQTGEVYISFVISSAGNLKDIQLIENKSSRNEYLGETALRSVRGSAPFPAFPKELDYAQLSFNVIISFEIE